MTPPCPPWEADLGDEFREYFDTEVPTAIVHGDRDMSTPYENALELAPHFKRGKLVTVLGGSHGALREALEADAAFAEAIWTFVRTGNLDALPDSVALPPVEWEIPGEGDR
jgi:pimeloyl-ACP methyl ester carboxylesterase